MLIEMEKNEKCIEYYLDSKIYNREAVEKTIQEAKQEFPGKEADISIYLNEWGVYVVSLYFRNKNNILQNVNAKIKPKRIRRKKNKSDYSYQTNINTQPRRYGQYKTTGTYKPY